MKKLILFLLLPLWIVAQTSTGQEQEFDYGIKNNSTQTITTPPYLTTTGIDGTQGKIPSALVEKTDNKQNSLAVDGTGTKYPTVDAVNAALPRNYTKVVYVNSTAPSTATIFDDENPPVVNDDLLKSDVANLYIGTDASPWVWNGSTYETKVVPASSNFYLSGTTVDAGNSKIEPIERSGVIKSGGVVTDGVYANAINVAFETPNTIASFDSGKQLRSLSTDTYPSLTELSYVKGGTSGFQAQINGKADLDGSGKVPLSQINDALLGSVNYKGTYNATTNVPAIPTATSSNKGWYYIISTAGTQQGFNFVNGDWIISNGTSWGKVDNNNTVTSVNGQVGAVNITASGIGAQTTLTNPVTGTGTGGYVSFWNGTNTQTGDSGLFWNNTNKRLGIGVTSPSEKLEVAGAIKSSGSLETFKANTASMDFDFVTGFARLWSIGGNSSTLGSLAVRLRSSDGSLGLIPLNISNLGKIGIAPSITGLVSPTAYLHIGAGTGAAGTAPLKLTSGVLNTTPEVGALEFFTNSFYGTTASGVRNKFAFLESPAFTGAPTAPTAPVGTNTTQIATMEAVQAAITNNGIITTATNITNATLTDSGLPQSGKTLYISNGATNINYTVNGGITASFVKGGTGSITFVQGSGRTMVAANGTLVFNGAQYSTASIVSFGTTDILYINNF